MAFQSVGTMKSMAFNSTNSLDFIEDYTAFLESRIADENAEEKSKTIAPSSFRCNRISWFRLRGTQPDVLQKPDLPLDFTAMVGTACHRYIQENLEMMPEVEWIEVPEYLKEHCSNHTYTLKQNGPETLIEFTDIPVRFACDGIIRYKGKIYLLEIKTSGTAAFNDMYKCKDQHIDQIKCYATLLNLQDVLVLYQERTWGSLKCYEMHITDEEVEDVLNRFKYIMHMVECNIPPDGLPKGDSWCTRCIYANTCKQWGR